MLSFQVKCAILILGELDRVKDERPGLKACEIKLRLNFPHGIQHLLSKMKSSGLLQHNVYKGLYSSNVDLSTLSLWELITRLCPEKTITEWPPISKEYPEVVDYNYKLKEYCKSQVSKIFIADLVRKEGASAKVQEPTQYLATI